jgi:hypothetical protein
MQTDRSLGYALRHEATLKQQLQHHGTAAVLEQTSGIRCDINRNGPQPHDPDRDFKIPKHEEW